MASDFVRTGWLATAAALMFVTAAAARNGESAQEAATPQASQQIISVQQQPASATAPIILAQAEPAMPVRTVLTSDQLKAALLELPGWTLAEDGKSINKEFVFSDFSEAFGFMTRIALVAEQLNHHPQWSNVYKSVKIMLATYHEDAVTDLDITLARSIEKIAGPKK